MPRWRNGRRARFRCECWEACRFESYSGHKEFWWTPFFVPRIGLGQRVAPRQTHLWSVVVCYANIRVCCAIVAENKFSPHRPSIPTIFDCNNLPSVCSRLLPPFESRCCVFDNLSRYCTKKEQSCELLFFCAVTTTFNIKARDIEANGLCQKAYFCFS